MMFRSREYELSEKLIKSCIAEHMAGIERLDRLDEYYKGSHKILSRRQPSVWAPNNRLVCNFAKYITDTAVGYAFGNPISYVAEEGVDIGELLKLYKNTDAATHDSELAKDLSVFGTGYELVYMSSDDESIPKLAVIDPRNAFVVYDDSVEQKPLYGVYYTENRDIGGKTEGYLINVFTETEARVYHSKDLSREPVLRSVNYNYFGKVPLVEYFNNEEGMGDFENVISLIDAYNTLESDRVNDKERFVDAILLIRGCQLPDDESASKMLASRILELPFENADASYITKTLNESEIEVLRNALSSDIHKFSQTPDFADERFSGNSSGVALRYKLLSLENLAKIKERYFASGLKERAALFLAVLKIKAKQSFDISGVKIVFNRALPVNIFELAQTIATLKGFVSTETLTSLLPFVEDAASELEKLNTERNGSAEEYINSGYGAVNGYDR